jgi:hypothetical protein
MEQQGEMTSFVQVVEYGLTLDGHVGVAGQDARTCQWVPQELTRINAVLTR